MSCTRKGLAGNSESSWNNSEVFIYSCGAMVETKFMILRFVITRKSILQTVIYTLAFILLKPIYSLWKLIDRTIHNKIYLYDTFVPFTGWRCRPRNHYFECQRGRCYLGVSKIGWYFDNAASGLQKCKSIFFLFLLL